VTFGYFGEGGSAGGGINESLKRKTPRRITPGIRYVSLGLLCQGSAKPEWICGHDRVELSLAHRLGFTPPHFAADKVLARSVQPQNVVYLAR
jgi:hypothetical protein